MTMRFRSVVVTGLLCGYVAGVAAAVFADQSPLPAASPKAESTKDACLACHGPFSALAERTRGFEAPSGEKTTPHRNVPHQSSEPGIVPECENCHQKHPVPHPAADQSAREKPKIEYCYGTCHHTKEFTPCKACHIGSAL